MRHTREGWQCWPSGWWGTWVRRDSCRAPGESVPQTAAESAPAESPWSDWWNCVHTHTHTHRNQCVRDTHTHTKRAKQQNNETWFYAIIQQSHMCKIVQEHSWRHYKWKCVCILYLAMVRLRGRKEGKRKEMTRLGTSRANITHTPNINCTTTQHNHTHTQHTHTHTDTLQ